MQHTAVDVFANTPAPPIHVLPEKSLLSPAGHLWAEKSSSDCLGPFSNVATKTTIKDDVSWHELGKIRLLARGGSSLVYSATYHGKSVVVKTLRPKIRQSHSAMSDIESELGTYCQVWGYHYLYDPLLTSFLANNSNHFTSGPRKHCKIHWSWTEQLWRQVLGFRETG